VKQQGKDEFWANPKKDLLGQEWWLILNNNETMELVVMKVPAAAIALSQDGTPGLLVRVDKPDLIDLNINTSTFKDRKSGIDLSQYIQIIPSITCQSAVTVIICVNIVTIVDYKIPINESKQS